MSLPGPLPYEPKRFGAQREPPVKAPRAYLERLQLAGELVEENELASGSLRASLPTLAQILLVLGALAPLAYAVPGARDALFGSLVRATSPLSAPLVIMSDWLVAGWHGALLIILAGSAGLIAGRIASSPRTQESARSRLLGAVAIAFFSLVAAGLLVLFASTDAIAASAGGAWVIMTGAAGLYGALLTARRENWLGAVSAGTALFSGGRVVFGSLAVLALVLCDRAFPGQTVARNPWKRSQVAIEPIEPPAVQGTAADDGMQLRVKPPRPQALFVATIALVFGAFEPVVLAIPAFGAALFGPLLIAIWPVSYFALLGAVSVQGAVATLFAGGPDPLWALLALVWFLLIPVAGGLIGARAVARRERRWAAVAGACLIIVGGRPLFGLAALVAISYAWPLFDRAEEGAEAPKEPAPGAAAH